MLTTIAASRTEISKDEAHTEDNKTTVVAAQITGSEVNHACAVVAIAAGAEISKELIHGDISSTEVKQRQVKSEFEESTTKKDTAEHSSLRGTEDSSSVSPSPFTPITEGEDYSSERVDQDSESKCGVICACLPLTYRLRCRVFRRAFHRTRVL